eukprot:15458701-Heterocapsa_arctica.AAC.1
MEDELPSKEMDPASREEAQQGGTSRQTTHQGALSSEECTSGCASSAELSQSDQRIWEVRARAPRPKG